MKKEDVGYVGRRKTETTESGSAKMCYFIEDKYDTCDHFKLVQKIKSNFKMKKQGKNLVKKTMENVRSKGLISHNLTVKHI